MIEKRWLTDREVAARYSVSRITVWRWSRTGHLPAPYKIGPNTSRWSAEELVEFDRGILERRRK